MSKKSKSRKELNFRSSAELNVYNLLTEKGIRPLYEPHAIKYSVSLIRRYIPDFVLDNGIILEVKGYFRSSDRSKHLLLRKDQPLLDVRFVFVNKKNKLHSKSKTTYEEWCEKNGFLCCDIKELNTLLNWANEKTAEIKLDRRVFSSSRTKKNTSRTSSVS